MSYTNKAFVLFPYHTLVLQGGRSRVGWSTEDRVWWYLFLGEVHILSPIGGIEGFVRWSWHAEWQPFASTTAWDYVLTFLSL